ncbi:MAG: DUF5685 family protein [Oscillospiraceae bacterium]|jgi:hypothetical protein|nr:DUF5685 family protein [Oscillospiraceae bacterium]
MFGYVRPLRCELRVADWERFRAAYCGLCHTLAREYGWKARYLLGYDFTFLALALSLYEAPARPGRRRCPTHPFRRRPCLASGEAMRAAADLTVLLTYHKWRDTVQDESGLTALAARLGGRLLRGACRKAAARRPETAAEVVRALTDLRTLEEARTPAIDPPADAFARLLASLGDLAPEESGRRVLRRLLYHLGRWIYLMDACQDLPADTAKGRYNPVAARYRIADGALTGEARASLGETALCSRREMELALSLLPDTPDTPVVANIILDGLPHTEAQVLSGRWTRTGRSLVSDAADIEDEGNMG